MSVEPAGTRVVSAGPGGYFFVIGAMKAGTSSLYKYLASHPSIYAAPRKEPKFFANGAATAADAAAYARLFAGRRSEAWAFEASTAYTKYPMIAGVPDRIHAAFPEARLVYLMRDPVERIYSAYLHNVAEGRERRSFEDAVFDGSEAYLNISRYHLQLSEYLRVFPRDRILILLFEELVADPGATLAQVARFLCLAPGFGEMRHARRYNETASKRAPLPALKALAPLLRLGAVPSRVKTWARAALSRPLPSKLDIADSRVHARIREELEEDGRQLRALLGRTFDQWESHRPSR